MLILGVDPGSRATGFGVIDCRGTRIGHRASGIVRPKEAAFERRLKEIYDGLTGVIEEHRPDVVAIEDIFQSRNARSALLLGHARGVAILSAVNHDIQVFAYPPAVVKRAVSGAGGASKRQVGEMVRVLLSLDRVPPSDAADALAVAICHSLRSRH